MIAYLTKAFKQLFKGPSKAFERLSTGHSMALASEVIETFHFAQLHKYPNHRAIVNQRKTSQNIRKIKRNLRIPDFYVFSDFAFLFDFCFFEQKGNSRLALWSDKKNQERSPGKSQKGSLIRHLRAL